MYAIKFEIAVSAFFFHYIIFIFKGQVGCTHNFMNHKRNYKKILPYLWKIERENDCKYKFHWSLSANQKRKFSVIFSK
jgi:hypothetical protein